MSLAKACVTGTVFRTPEKRYTPQTNIAIYSLVLNIGEQEETLIRVISKRKALEGILDKVRQGDKILVDGRLQIATSKYTDGTDKKFYEIDASAVEIMQNTDSTTSTTGQFVEPEVQPQDNNGDDEEIPF